MFNRRGQNVVEYSILIALVVGAAIAMQTYVKRGIQGRIQETVKYGGAAQDVGGTSLNFTGMQYEPYYQESSGEVQTNRTQHDAFRAEGEVTRTDIVENTTRIHGATETAIKPKNWTGEE